MGSLGEAAEGDCQTGGPVIVARCSGAQKGVAMLNVFAFYASDASGTMVVPSHVNLYRC